MATRYSIRIDPWWRPLLLVGAATADNSYVDVGEEAVEVQFGLFHRTIPRSEIEGAEPKRWPVWMGVGWRTDLRGTFGLIGSYQGVVEIRLRTPLRVWGVLNCPKLAVSLEEPDRFLEELGAAPKRETAPSETPRSEDAAAEATSSENAPSS